MVRKICRKIRFKLEVKEWWRIQHTAVKTVTKSSRYDTLTAADDSTVRNAELTLYECQQQYQPAGTSSVVTTLSSQCAITHALCWAGEMTSLSSHTGRHGTATFVTLRWPDSTAVRWDGNGRHQLIIQPINESHSERDCYNVWSVTFQLWRRHHLLAFFAISSSLIRFLFFLRREIVAFLR